jgi:Uma2 family endonuclease
MLRERRQYSLSEFEALAALPENASLLLELVNGEIVQKMPTEFHALIAGNFFVFLRDFVRPRGLGRVLFEVRHRHPADPRNARIPDVSFTRAECLQPIVVEGPVLLIPDLCVEVQSPNDTPKAMREKAAFYLANGAQIVWLAYTKKRRMVEALYADGEFDIFTEGDTLTAGDLLPGFAVLVKNLFEE